MRTGPDRTSLPSVRASLLGHIRTLAAAGMAATFTAPLAGILISDQPWVETPKDPIGIGPSETISLNFRVVRAKRPAESGALSAKKARVVIVIIALTCLCFAV